MTNHIPQRLALIVTLLGILSSFDSGFFTQVRAADKSCPYMQFCLRTPEQEGQFCPNTAEIENPLLIDHEPAKLNMSAMFQFMQACPFMDAQAPVCCIDDQVAIMATSFGQIDGVFGNDVPICGVNLKKLWCNFACDPQMKNYVKGLGYTTAIVKDKPTNLTEIEFVTDEDMACTLFQSCSKVSLIAQASLQSSISFLDFLVSLSDYFTSFEGSEWTEPVSDDHYFQGADGSRAQQVRR